MRPAVTNDDAQALALSALAWTLADGDRADRLLALTGLDGSSLRARVGEPAVLAACLGFLQSHQPDLVACADAIGTTPDRLVQAQEELER